MAKPRASIIPDAKAAFRKEVRVQRAKLDMTQNALGESIGVSESQISKMLADPDGIKTGKMREIVQAIEPDPAIILGLLGYSKKAIDNFRKEGGCA